MFIQINCCHFLFFGHNLSLLKNKRFLPKILVCDEMYFVETRGKTESLFICDSSKFRTIESSIYWSTGNGAY